MKVSASQNAGAISQQSTNPKSHNGWSRVATEVRHHKWSIQQKTRNDKED